MIAQRRARAGHVRGAGRSARLEPYAPDPDAVRDGLDVEDERHRRDARVRTVPRRTACHAAVELGEPRRQLATKGRERVAPRREHGLRPRGSMQRRSPSGALPRACGGAFPRDRHRRGARRSSRAGPERRRGGARRRRSARAAVEAEEDRDAAQEQERDRQETPEEDSRHLDLPSSHALRCSSSLDRGIAPHGYRSTNGRSRLALARARPS
ncbi:LigA [Anaeromyxobacter sp. Fw109-5]|nr:LigA [Anaeromyxobacter sp. Fw109-5]